MDGLFHLETAIKTEATRKLMLLGLLIQLLNFDYKAFRKRAWEIGVPVGILNEWYRLYQGGGLDALQPNNWLELDEKQQAIALKRYELIQPYADQPIIEDMEGCLAIIASRAGVSISTARRWLRRYRIDGLWGLTPAYNPLQRPSIKPVVPPQRDIGSFDEATLQIIYERRAILGVLPEREHVTQAEVDARAREVKKSSRTLWNYLHAYRKYGLAGLAPKQRHGEIHLSERMVDIIVGIRLKHSTITYKQIHERAAAIAGQMQEDIPSLWQVQNVCRNIPEPLFLFGTGRRNKFRNKYQITYSIQFEGIIYQIDHSQIDVLARDLRKPRFRSKSGVVRLWLTTCLECRSRVVVAYHLGYEKPNRHTVAAVIREGILSQPGGLPDEIWVDNGAELVSHHVEELTRELGIVLHKCREGEPQLRGRKERLYGTLNTMLWNAQPGYVGSNLEERPPNVKAKLTPYELVEELEGFLQTKYHNVVHDELGVTPIQFWNENCFAPPIDDVRILDLLLLESSTRTVSKKGIEFGNRIFWHPDLGLYVGNHVLIRADTRYETPDQIEVFYDEHWICTAIATDSDRGMAVSNIDVGEAKMRQKNHFRETAREAKRALKEAKDGIKKSAKPRTISISKPDQGSPTPPIAQKRDSNDKRKKPLNTLEHIYDLTNNTSEEKT